MKRSRGRVFIESGEEDEILLTSEDDVNEGIDEEYKISESSDSSDCDILNLHSVPRANGNLKKNGRKNNRSNMRKNNEPLPKKRKVIDTVADNANRRGSRNRLRTDRFGARESTVNLTDFFKNLAAQRKEDTNSNGSPTNLVNSSPGSAAA